MTPPSREALIAQGARDVLMDTVAEFAKLDRSGLADKVLMPRLQVIDVG